MPFSSRRWLLLAAISPLSLLGLAPARADQADAFNFSLSQGWQHDDNLFRLSPQMLSVYKQAGRKTSDDQSTTSLIAMVDKTYSLQRLRAKLSYNLVRYQRNSYLDYNGHAYDAGWDWRIGKRFSGTVSWNSSESQSSFADMAAVKNINRRTSRSISANYWFHPDWTIGASATGSESSNPSAVQKTSDFRSHGHEFLVRYTPRSGNSLDLAVRESNGRYPNRQVVAGVSTVDNSYIEKVAELRGNWQLSGLSRISFRAGQTKRQHDEVSARNFKGFTGNLSWDWQPTGKLAFKTSARREIGATDDTTANYVVTTAYSFMPVWSLSAKSSVQGRLERTERSYGGDPVTAFSGAEKRNDTIQLIGLSASWAPDTALMFSAYANREKRKSNMANSDYRDTTVGVSAQFSF